MRSIMGWFITALVACAAIYQLWWADAQVGGSFLLDDDQEKSSKMVEDLLFDLKINGKGLLFFPVPRRDNKTYAVPIMPITLQVGEAEVELTSAEGYRRPAGYFTFWKWTRLAMDCICAVHIGPDVVAQTECGAQSGDDQMFCYQATSTFMSDFNMIYSANNGTLLGEALFWTTCLLIALYCWFAVIVKVRRFRAKGVCQRRAAWLGCGCPWRRCRRPKDAAELAAATVAEGLRNEFQQRVASVLGVGVFVSMVTQVFSNLWYSRPELPPHIEPENLGPVVLVQGIALLPYVAGWARSSPRSYSTQLNILASVSIMFYTVHQRMLYRQNVHFQGSLHLHVQTFMLRLFQVLLVGELHQNLAGQVAISITRDLCGGFLLRPLFFGTAPSPAFMRDIEGVWLVAVILVSSSLELLFSGQAEAMVAVQFAELEMGMLKRSLVNISDAHCRLNAALVVDGEFPELAFMLGKHVKALSGIAFSALIDDDHVSSFEDAIAGLEQCARGGDTPSTDVYTTLKTAYSARIRVRLHINCSMALEGCVYYIVVQEFGDDARLAAAGPCAEDLSVEASVIGAASEERKPRLTTSSTGTDTMSEDQGGGVGLATAACGAAVSSSADATVIGASAGQFTRARSSSRSSISEDAESVASFTSTTQEGSDCGPVTLTVDVSTLKVASIVCNHAWVSHILRQGKKLDKLLKDPKKFRKELDAGIEACASGEHAERFTADLFIRCKKQKVILQLLDGTISDFLLEGKDIFAVVSARVLAWKCTTQL